MAEEGKARQGQKGSGPHQGQKGSNSRQGQNRSQGGGMGMGMGMGMMGGMGMGALQDDYIPPKQDKEIKPPSKLALFLRGALFDFVLVMIVSVCLTSAVSFGFESAPELRSNLLLIAGITLPMVLFLFIGGWSKRAIALSAILCIVYGVGLIVALQMLTPPDVALFVDSAINDVADNYAVFGMVAAIVPVFVFLLSRRRFGVFVLFFLGVLACQFTQFMFRDWMDSEPALAICLVCYLCMAAMFVYQSYRSAIYHAHRVKTTHFAGASVYSVVLGAIVLGIGVALFFGVIANLGLSTPDIKPFQDIYQRDIVEYTGVYSEKSVDNPDLLTDQTNDNQLNSNQDAKGGEDEQSPEDDDSQGANPISTLIEQLSNFDINDWQQMFNTINYQQMVLNALMFLIPLAALIFLIVWLWKRRRVKRLEKIAGEAPAYKVWFLWNYLEERLRRLGHKKPDTLTPMEYAMASRSALEPFSRGTGGVDHLQLTLIYQRAIYAGGSVSDEDYQKFEQFYNAFFDNARQQSGRLKWLFRFWRM